MFYFDHLLIYSSIITLSQLFHHLVDSYEDFCSFFKNQQIKVTKTLKSKIIKYIFYFSSNSTINIHFKYYMTRIIIVCGIVGSSFQIYLSTNVHCMQYKYSRLSFTAFKLATGFIHDSPALQMILFLSFSKSNQQKKVY